MRRFILQRFLLMFFVLLGVSAVIFTLEYITPGDPALQVLGAEATQEQIDTFNHQHGLDQPFVLQYLTFVKNIVLHGDFGTSYTYNRPVLSMILERFPTTFTLAVLSVFVGALIGITLGVISAVKQYSVYDSLAVLFAMLGTSMPSFWMAMELIVIFSVQLHWLPSSGFYGPVYWILPVLTISLHCAATVTRMTRSSMLEVIRQDYVRTARAKGQTMFLTIVVHALKNAIIPIITVIGMQLGYQLGGAVLVETVFSIPGLGKLMVDSISSRDYPVVQGGVLFLALIFSFVNLAVDIIYAYVDPRIRKSYGASGRRRVRTNESGQLGEKAVET